MTLSEIGAACQQYAANLQFEVDFKQSDYEGQIIDWIHEARKQTAGMVMNLAALSTSSDLDSGSAEDLSRPHN